MQFLIRILQSRTVKAGIVVILAALVGLAASFGIIVSPEIIAVVMNAVGVSMPLAQFTSLVSGLVDLVTLAGGIAAIVYRINPNQTFKK